MTNGFFKVPDIKNEPILDYAPGSPERKKLVEQIEKMRNQIIEIPQVINGKLIFTNKTTKVSPPHDHKHLLAYCHEGENKHIDQAIEAALAAKENWENMPWEHRSSIFLKAAALSAGKYRAELNAATMLGQSKNVYQAEIDSACEWVDFLRFNTKFVAEIYQNQPISGDGLWNRVEYRALEGFVLAITPFNFTAIAGNLPVAAAIMGNVVVWKPSPTQVYSAHVLMKILLEAGLPAGVINMIFTDGPATGEKALKHPDLAGVHFTGSTKTFQLFWKTIGANIENYKTYPKIVGETGGKDFVLAHESANITALVTGLVRGAFEYQGQKCSAASRAYIPKSIWPEVKNLLLEQIKSIKMGGTEDFGNFVNAVIDERSFDKIMGFINEAKASSEVEVIAGGQGDKSKGYFIEATVLLTTNPKYSTMCNEIFGPVLTIYLYEPADFEHTCKLVDSTSSYALTGAIFSQDRDAIVKASQLLKHAAGNFYINDKPTGAVVGQQPFGGARQSGTNDKAGSMLNLLRWVSPRTIKETLVSPEQYGYPFMG